MNERRPPGQPGQKEDEQKEDEKPTNPSGPTPEARQPGRMNADMTTSDKSADAALSRQVQAKLGQQLRSYYERLIEPPPDRFVDLLRQLDKPGSKDKPE